MQPPGSYAVPPSPQQWQPGPPSGGPTPDPMGGFQPSSTPGQRILAAAGLLSGQPGPGGPGPQSQDPQAQAAMIAGQLDDATLIRLLQQRAAQGGFPGGVPGSDQHGQQQQQHHPQHQQQQQGMQHQQMQNPQHYGGSPPQSGGYGGGGPVQFGEMRPGLSSPPPAPSTGGGAPGSQTTGNSGGGGGKGKTRARRGQATDPHSIAERLRRERIAERMRSLQELVPNSNKVDKASMLDDIIDYVKFLQLQVKVLNLNRLTGPAADAVASLLADLDPADEKDGKGALTPQEMELTERQVALLMEQDMGMAMQYLQGKGLCLMPMALAGMMNKGQGPGQGQGQGQGHTPGESAGQGRLEGAGGDGRGAPGGGEGGGGLGGGVAKSEEGPVVKQEMNPGGEGDAQMSEPGGV